MSHCDDKIPLLLIRVEIIFCRCFIYHIFFLTWRTNFWRKMRWNFKQTSSLRWKKLRGNSLLQRKTWRKNFNKKNKRSLIGQFSIVARFCYHLSGNHVDLVDLHGVLSLIHLLENESFKKCVLALNCQFILLACQKMISTCQILIYN